MAFPAPLRSRLPRRILGLTFVSIGLLAAGLGGLMALRPPQEVTGMASAVLNEFWRDRFQYQLSRPVTILVMGIDQFPEATSGSDAQFGGRSDTLLVVRFDPQQQSVALLSIPRDTEVEFPNGEIGKVNEANYWGGTKLATETIEELLTPLKLDRYVRVSRGAFQELVDLLGGVEVLIPYPMAYTDQTQQLKIELASGWQTLNGEQADQFVRFRSDAYGDIGRIQRQQALLQAIRERLQRPGVLPQLPKMIRVMQKYVDTNLGFEEMLTLANFGLDLEPDQFQMVMLPGRSSGSEEALSSYWLMDNLGRDRVLSQYFDLNTGIDLATPNQPQPPLPLDVQVAIQNASGDAEAGKKLLERLADQGFYNVYLADSWPDRELQTQIIVQRGNLTQAEQLQKLLGLGRIEAASTGEIGSELTIRLGEDW
ncbi:MAG: LCP family protein [Oscillatoriales cyanobacterium RM2_1_1]|nr:LCP family protein [Oscillatoriales cyanobacterium RM2_1_1]